MITVLLKDDDAFYWQSMMGFIQDFLHTELDKNARFTHSRSKRSVAGTDLIIASVGSGDLNSCLLTLRGSNPARVIGLYDRETDGVNGLMPQCALPLSLMSRQSSLSVFRDLILLALFSEPRQAGDPCAHSPSSCRGTLTQEQSRVMSGLLSGRRPRDIVVTCRLVSARSMSTSI
ncbi:TPA: hypothetical protein J4Z76_001308 [Escherichia coli]|nr:hypothetical protein [Escherichia coli]HCQ0091572.1 hypothetical protein [Escherichia coli]